MTLTKPMLLCQLGRDRIEQLWTLDPDDGWFGPLMRHPRPALVVMAYDGAAPVGWSIVERSGLACAFVTPRRRREGIGSRCFTRAFNAARRRWPGARFEARPPDRKGRLFFQGFGFRVARAA